MGGESVHTPTYMSVFLNSTGSIFEIDPSKQNDYGTVRRN